MPPIGPKEAQRKALREAAYSARQQGTKPAPDATTKAEKARAALESVRQQPTMKAKRKKSNTPQTEEASFDKAAYQREYMRKRRATANTITEKETVMAKAPKPASKPMPKPSKPGKPSGKKGC